MIFKLNCIDGEDTKFDSSSFLRNNYSNINISQSNSTIRSITPSRNQQPSTTIFNRNTKLIQNSAHKNLNRSLTPVRTNQRLDSPLRSPSSSPITQKQNIKNYQDLEYYNVNEEYMGHSDDTNFEILFSSNLVQKEKNLHARRDSNYNI
jgi:hypothetical protein